MQQDLIVFYITNKGMNGQDKKAGYYASGYMPAGLAEYHPGKVFIVDIDAPENQAFLNGDLRANLYAFPVDKDYTASAFRDYQKHQILFDEKMRHQVAMLVPYTSSEASPNMLRHIKQGYPENVVYTNDPESMAIHNSKGALIRVKEDPEASEFQGHINPQTFISTLEDYQRYRIQHRNFVLRSLRSTEGLGVYFHAPDYHEGQVEVVEENPEDQQYTIDNLLQKGPLLATKYVDTRQTGDTRVFVFYHPETHQMSVFQQGGRRMAPKATTDNRFPKCNVTSGGSATFIDLTEPQKKLALKIMKYYHDYYGMHMLGLDFFFGGDTSASHQGMILSEVNNSPDAFNCFYDQSISEKPNPKKRGDYLVIQFLDNFYRYALETVKTPCLKGVIKGHQPAIIERQQHV